jgi:hypothetical protein
MVVTQYLGTISFFINTKCESHPAAKYHWPTWQLTLQEIQNFTLSHVQDHRLQCRKEISKLYILMWQFVAPSLLQEHQHHVDRNILGSIVLCLPIGFILSAFQKTK